YLLTGRPPFERANIMEVMLAHTRDPIAPPSKIREDVPSDLEQVILKCLAKGPAERFQTAEALEQALAACRDADSWGDAEAERWWREIAPGQGSPPDIDTASADLATVLGVVPPE